MEKSSSNWGGRRQCWKKEWIIDFFRNNVVKWLSLSPVLLSVFPINCQNSSGAERAFCTPNADGIVFGIENTFLCIYWQVLNGCLHHSRGRNETVIGHIWKKSEFNAWNAHKSEREWYIMLGCWVYHLIKWKRLVPAISVESQHFHMNSIGFFLVSFFILEIYYSLCVSDVVVFAFFAYIYRSIIIMMTTTMTYFHAIRKLHKVAFDMWWGAWVERIKNIWNFIMFWNK